MNKIENINLLPDTEPDSGDYTGEDGLLYRGKCRKPKKPISQMVATHKTASTIN